MLAIQFSGEWDQTQGERATNEHLRHHGGKRKEKWMGKKVEKEEKETVKQAKTQRAAARVIPDTRRGKMEKSGRECKENDSEKEIILQAVEKQ